MPILGRDVETNPIHEADLAAVVADALAAEPGVVEETAPEDSAVVPAPAPPEVQVPALGPPNSWVQLKATPFPMGALL